MADDDRNRNAWAQVSVEAFLCGQASKGTRTFVRSEREHRFAGRRGLTKRPLLEEPRDREPLCTASVRATAAARSRSSLRLPAMARRVRCKRPCVQSGGLEDTRSARRSSRDHNRSSDEQPGPSSNRVPARSYHAPESNRPRTHRLDRGRGPTASRTSEVLPTTPLREILDSSVVHRASCIQNM
jgi:hypothetical protein